MFLGKLSFAVAQHSKFNSYFSEHKVGVLNNLIILKLEDESKHSSAILSVHFCTFYLCKLRAK